jgi:hypothetical protein
VTEARSDARGSGRSAGMSVEGRRGAGSRREPRSLRLHESHERRPILRPGRSSLCSEGEPRPEGPHGGPLREEGVPARRGRKTSKARPATDKAREGAGNTSHLLRPRRGRRDHHLQR